MRFPGLRPATTTIYGIAHCLRMLDKIRLTQSGTLPEGYYPGDADFTWWDARCCRFLGVSYSDLRAQVEAGADDDEVLQWCLENGSKPNSEQIQIWSTFLLKRGWRDESSVSMEQEKQACGLGARGDIVTWAELQATQEV